MKKIFSGILAAVLLLGSFPIRNYCGAMISDIMRLAGFILLIIFIVLRINDLKK